MPLYEYQCDDCHHRFELLRPAREAAMPQPCSRCDADSRRVMSKQWSAFIFREGRPRQLPDDGGYYHLGKKVTQPITGSVQGIEHPEINRKPPPKPLTIEEMERYEYTKEQSVRHLFETGLDATDGAAQQEMNQRFVRRGTAREEQVKRRVRTTVAKLEYQKRQARRR